MSNNIVLTDVIIFYWGLINFLSYLLFYVNLKFEQLIK